MLAGAVRNTVPALRDPAHHLISASSLSDAVTPAIVLAGDVLDPAAASRRRDARDLPRPRTMDPGLPLPRTPDRRTSGDPVTITVGGSGGTTVSLGNNAAAGTTITVGPDGRTVTVRVGGAAASGAAGPATPGPRSTGLVGALSGEQRTVAR